MKRKTHKKLTLKDVITTAKDAGVKVTCSMKPKPQMPYRSEKDHPLVLALVDESERMTKVANQWSTAEHPNPVAAEAAFRNGWAFSLAAAWLRCYLNGELAEKPKEQAEDEFRLFVRSMAGYARDGQTLSDGSVYHMSFKDAKLIANAFIDHARNLLKTK